MAQVPVRDSQLSLQPTPIDPATAATFGKEIVDVSEGLSGFGQQMQKLQDKTETLKAETFLAQKHNEALTMAHTDPDVWGVEDKIEKEYDSGIQEAGKLIKSTEARNAFLSKAALETERKKVGIQNVIYHRQSQDFKGTLLQANDADIQEYQNAADPDERNLIKQGIIDRTHDAMDSGFIDRAYGQRYLETHLKAMDLGQVSKDIGIEPEGAKRELEKGADGIYKDLNDKERQAMIDKADQVIKRKENTGKRVAIERRNNNEHDLALKQLEGVDISSEIEEGLYNKTVSRTFFDKAVANGASPVGPTAETDKKVYHDLINNLLDEKTTPDKAREAILDANTNGKLSVQDARKLFKMHLIPEEDSFTTLQDKLGDNADPDMKFLDQQEKKTKALTEKKGVLKSVWDLITGHAGDDKPKAAQMMMDVQERAQKDNVKTDGLQDVATQVVRKDVLKTRPEFARYPKEGKVLFNPKDGKKYRAFPDGNIVEEK